MFDLNLRNMRNILTIVEEGSLSKAADKLNTTQPNLSRIVLKTEEQFALPLFDKEKTPWHLTYLGEIYISAAKKMLKCNDQFINDLKSIADHQKGLIKIGVMSFEERYLLPDILSAFKTLYPKLMVETISVPPIEIEELLYKNLVDFAILVKTDNKHIEYIPIKKLDILLALPISHKLAKGYKFPKDNESFPEIEMKMLADEPFVMMKGTFLAERVKKLALDSGFELKIELAVSTSDAAIATVKKGYCASFVIDKYIVNDVAYFKIKDENLQQEVSFSYLKNKKSSNLEEKLKTIFKRKTFDYIPFEYK